MQLVSAANMKAAIQYLFNQVHPGNQEKRPTAAGDLDRYAEIASFMTNEEAFLAAMQGVAGWFQAAFDERPQDYQIVNTDGLWQRRAGLANEVLEGRKTAFTQSGGVIETEGKPINPDTLLRTFHFRPLLQKIEADRLGVVDKGRIMFGDPGETEFGQVLRAGEVWKDSIAFNHGEYTHRLQWLAIAFHFRDTYGPIVLLRLYKCAANPIKGASKSAIEALKAGLAADPKVTIAGSLWNFLVDCFPVSEQNDRVFEPADAITGDAATNPATFKYAGRADSYRSPDAVMRLLRRESSLGIVHAYITSSYMKVGNGSLTKYRRERLQTDRGKGPRAVVPEEKKAQLLAKQAGKFILNQFLPNDGGALVV